MSTETVPYIVSSDLHSLMKGWSSATGFSIPHDLFFYGMTKDLESVLKGYYNNNVELISESELSKGLEKMASMSKYPIVSMDRAYVDSDTPNIVYFLDVTRAVNEHLEDIGLFPRPGFPSLDVQLKTISQGSGPVNLLDDVIFSGKGICDLAIELERKGRPVKQVFAGVGISEGVENLRALGIEVQCVREYGEVVDEVCERDYYAGVPMSGRTVLAGSGEIWSAPYFHPFGKPEKWASIPANRIFEFSRFCLTQSLVLWATVEKHSNTAIPTKSVPRRVFGIPEDVSIVSFLREHIDKFELSG